MVYLVLSLDFVLHSEEVFVVSSSCLHICGPEESVADYRQLQTVAVSVCVEMWWVLMFLILPKVNKQAQIRSPGSFIHALNIAGSPAGCGTTGGRAHVVFLGCVQAPEWGPGRVD